MNKDLLLCGIAAVFSSLIFFNFFPSFSTFVDETDYIHQTVLLTEWKFYESSLESAYHFFQAGDKYISLYSVGVPLLAVLFLKFSSLFVMNFLFHLLSFYVFIKLLQKFQLPSFYSLLYLFHPGLVFFSRTVMSEIPSVFFLLLAFYGYYEEKKLWWVISGFCLGFAVLIRYTNVLAAVVLLVLAFFYHRKKCGFMIIGMMPYIFIIPLYNYFVNGGIFSVGYFHVSQIGSFQRSESILWNTIELFLWTISTLIIVYPLLLLSPFAYSGKFKLEFRALTLVYVLFFSMAILGTWTFHYDFLTNLIIGPRYIFPILPLILIPYISMVDSLFNRFILAKKIVLTTFFLVLVFVSIGVSYKQYSYTSLSNTMSQQIYAQTPPDSLLIGSAFSISLLNPSLGNRRAFAFHGYSFPEVIKGQNNTYAVIADHGDGKEYTHLEHLEQMQREVLDKVPHELIYEQRNPLVLIWKLTP